MPDIDESTGQPVSDDPNQADDAARGGKQEGDPALKGASETGGDNVAEESE